ncbi:hypothetical protein WR25_17692 [Diploscapter pachys]|uniref:Uncharacterized protein n=1 Tax=Diploscapter pachys TaxID=2018661 RepID=A0A2A2KMM0_9BILA|nr:hypothetical protein WR25_17692 [Diploscapter pachys]
MHAAKSFGGFEKPNTPKVPFGNHFEKEKSTFEKNLDKSIGAVGQRSPPRPSVRTLRKEKTKPPPLPTREEIDARIMQDYNNTRPLSIMSNDTISTEYGSSSIHSPTFYARQHSAHGSLPAYETPMSRMSAAANYAFDSEPSSAVSNSDDANHPNPTLSRSWAGGAPLLPSSSHQAGPQQDTFNPNGPPYSHSHKTSISR